MKVRVFSTSIVTEIKGTDNVAPHGQDFSLQGRMGDFILPALVGDLNVMNYS